MSNPLDKLLAMKDKDGWPRWTRYNIAKVGGFSPNTVYDWASGHRKPNPKNLAKLKELEGMTG